MDDPTPTRPERKQPLLARLDAAAQDLNVMLLVLAIGLAILDFTCFFALEMRKAMPPHLSAASVSTPATAAIPPVEAAVARPGDGG